jgi:hypothetical protein
MVNALLLLWNDIEVSRTQEYERWHTLEHVPERVWVPGYVSGNRYASADEAFSKYFTVYELENIESLASREYQDLVEQPTPWSTSMRLSFSGFLRKTGPVVAGAGVSLGSVACAVRMVWDGGSAPQGPTVQALASRILREGAGHGVVRCRIMRVETVGPQAFSNVDAAPAGLELICVVEALHGRAMASLAAGVHAALASENVPAPLWAHHSLYDLSSSVRHSDVAGPTRPAPRLDLMPA